MQIEKLGDLCTGCYACSNICPQKAIELCPDQKGFAYPQIDDEKCVHCGVCDRICPTLNNKNSNIDKVDVDVYACWTLDKRIRFESTSGGFFSMLALEVLENGGHVCGAIYDDIYHISHTIIDSVDDLGKIRQSKYAQSDIGRSFVEVRSHLNDGKVVLFCGTPCECAGLKNFLGHPYDNLIVCDFICRGSNSPKAYKCFVESLESKYKSKCLRVWFKNKKYGWNRFSTYLEFENGKKYLKDRYTDYFMRGYLEKSLFLRPCCEDCRFKSHKNFSDITMGDFWGIEQYTTNNDTNGGTSVVFLNSKKGEEYFKKIAPQLYYEKHSYEEVLRANPSLEKSVKRSKDSDRFLADLDSNDFCDNIKKYCDYGFIYRAKHALKSILWKIRG